MLGTNETHRFLLLSSEDERERVLTLNSVIRKQGSCNQAKVLQGKDTS
jgi:hypothetical protein